MPNGKPGDHPLTDILVHRLDVFSPAIDEILREIESIGGWDTVSRVWDGLENNPAIWGTSGYKEELENRLRTIRDELRDDAEKRGFELPS